MSYRVFHALTDKASFVMTYLLRLVNGQEYVLIAASPDEVMAMPEDGDTWTGKLFQGGTIEVPDSQFLSVEPDRYRVTGNWSGNGNKTREMTGEDIADYTRNAGGEAKAISRIKDSDGNTVYDRDDGKAKRLKLD